VVHAVVDVIVGAFGLIFIARMTYQVVQSDLWLTRVLYVLLVLTAVSGLALLVRSHLHTQRPA